MSSIKYKLRKCSVPNCGTKRANGLHHFPTDLDQRNKWIEKCGLNKINSSSRICSLHFNRNDYLKKKLKIGSIPSQNLPVRNYSKKQASLINDIFCMF